MAIATNPERRAPLETEGGFPPDTAERLHARIDAWAAEDADHKGISAAVVLADGDEWFGAAGVAGGATPLRPHHMLSIASITKTATGAAILQLAQEGALSLDDSVTAILGEFEHVSPRITLRQLLNHSNGLFNYVQHPAYSAALARDRAKVFAPDEVMRDFIAEPSFEPGARTEYTNTAFLLLGMVVEKVTGKDIATVYRERFWEPLELDEFLLPFAEPARGEIAGHWTGNAGALSPVDPWDRASSYSTRWSAFGLVASARNVARWGHALFLGDLLDESTRAEMKVALPAAGNIPVESGVGLGLRRYEFFGQEQWGHSGGSAESSSLMLFDPATGITVAVLLNQPGQSVRGAHFRIAAELLQMARADG